MGKVSIGMRGWTFDEDDILDEDGDFLPFEAMPPDARTRLLRLDVILNAPCNACWLIHGDENLEQCNTARYVYGEPLDEVVLCAEHEPDFVYWFRSEGGADLRGEEGFDEAFYEWFLEGNRAPDGYEGMEYVDTAPDDLPKPPEPDPDEREAHAELTGDVDLSTEYPRTE